MSSDPKETPEVRLLRREHAAAAKAVGLLIGSRGIELIEYLEAEKVRSEAWRKLREALGLPLHFKR